MFLIDIEQAWNYAHINQTERALKYLNDEPDNFGSKNIKITLPLAQGNDISKIRLLHALRGAFLTAEFVHSTARTATAPYSKQAILH